MHRLLASLGMMVMMVLYAAPMAVILTPAAQAAPGITETELCKGANVGAGGACSNAADGSVDPGASDTRLKQRLTTIANIFLYLTGAVSVLVIIYGGFRYVTSTGDAKRIQAAKETILYAVAGLVVAIMAYGIVNFVINQFGG